MNKIDQDTFVVVSKHFGDAEWVSEYTDQYQIYDKSNDPLGHKSIRIPNVGFNFLAYFNYIIEHYENLPKRLMLIKNNIIGRHISKEYFEKVMNNTEFTMIVEKERLEFRMPDSYWDNGYMEHNYLNMYNKILYVRNPNEFFDFVFADTYYPPYIKFAPGGNFIVPKESILKLPKSLYQEMRLMIEHNQLSGESYIIERCIPFLWTQTMFKVREVRHIKTL